RQVLREHVVHEQEAGDDDAEQREEASPDQFEQQGFESLQRRQVLQYRRKVLVLEFAVQPGNEHRLHGGNGNDAEGRNAEQDVQRNAAAEIALRLATGQQQGAEYAQDCEWKQGEEQVVERLSETADDDDQRNGPAEERCDAKQTKVVTAVGGDDLHDVDEVHTQGKRGDQ